MATSSATPRVSLLHPSVEVRPGSKIGFELFDHRTGFHLAFDELPVSCLTEAHTAPVELRSVLADLGLTRLELSVAEVRALQHRFRDEAAWEERLERVRQLLSTVVGTVPYYRERFRDYDPERITSRDRLQELPVLRKQDLKAAFTQLWAEGINYKEEMQNGTLELVSTSGTSHERLQALADATLVRVPSNYDKLWGIAHIDESPRTAVLTSATCIGSQCTLRPHDFKARIVHDYTLFLPALQDPFSIEKPDLLAIVDEVCQFAPHFLLVNPVYAHCLGRRAKELGVSLPPFCALISTYQYLSNIQRRELAALFGAPVYDLYSATELGGCQMGIQCHRGRLHMREDHCLIEFMSRDGLADTKELGTLVVTTLAGRAMPLVRYALGDLGKRSSMPCDCPLSESPSFELHGREMDSLVIQDHWVTTRMVDEVVSTIDGVDFYCCKQLDESSVEIAIVPSLDRAVDTVELRGQLEAAIGHVWVDVKLVRRLEPAPSLKFPLSAGLRPHQPWLLERDERMDSGC